MSYKKLKLMKKMSGFSDNIAKVSTQRQKTLSEANTCLFFITAFYIICPLPLFTLGLYTIVQDNLMATTGSGWEFNLFVISEMFYLSNTGINSLIVILRKKNLRQFYKLGCCCLRRTVSFNSQNCNGVELNSI